MLTILLYDGKRESHFAKYRSPVVPAIGTLIDTIKGSYRVTDVWHDVRGDPFLGDLAHQTEARITVVKES